jgi:hypothetical protein
MSERKSVKVSRDSLHTEFQKALMDYQLHVYTENVKRRLIDCMTGKDKVRL